MGAPKILMQQVFMYMPIIVLIRKKIAWLNNIIFGVFERFYRKKINDLFIRRRQFWPKSMIGHHQDGWDAKEKILKTQKNLKELRKGPTIGAFIRVKNEAYALYLTVCSIAAFVSEIHIINNNSTDNLEEVVVKIKKDFPGIIVVYKNYSQDIAKYGPGYSEEVTHNSNLSIAKYYNFCKLGLTTDYVAKLDASNIFLPQAIVEIIGALHDFPEIIYIYGLEPYGRRFDSEPSIFKNNDDFTYIDSDFYEVLSYKGSTNNLSGLSAVRIDNPAFINIRHLIN